MQGRQFCLHRTRQAGYVCQRQGLLCYGPLLWQSHVLIQVFVLILWVVHASAGPPKSVAIPFCPKDLVPFVGAPVHRKCWVVIEWACESLFCYVCELPESLIHLRGSGPVVRYLDLPNGFVIFDLCSISVPAHEGIQFLGKGTCLQLPHNLWFVAIAVAVLLVQYCCPFRGEGVATFAIWCVYAGERFYPQLSIYV